MEIHTQLMSAGAGQYATAGGAGGAAGLLGNGGNG